MRATDFIAAIRKGKPGPVYLLRGPERFLHEQCRAAIVDSVPVEARPWCLTEVEFESGLLPRELQAAGQMPMLGGHSFILFFDPEDFKHATDEDTEALAAYLERPSVFATLVFVASEPDRRRRFIQSLEKKAEVVDMLPLTRQEAARWAADFLRRAGVSIGEDLAEEIAAKFESSHDREPDRAGVNLLWMRTELEKLLTGRPGAKRLEPSDLELIVAFREEHQIGKLLRAIADRKCGEALESLRALLASKVSETLLLWCVGDFFRQALKSGSALPFESRRGFAGYGAGRWNRSGNPFSPPEIAAATLKNYSRQELLYGLRLVRRADLGIKSSWKDARILLEFLVWQIVVGKGTTGDSPLVAEMPAPSAEG